MSYPTTGWHREDDMRQICAGNAANGVHLFDKPCPFPSVQVLLHRARGHSAYMIHNAPIAFESYKAVYKSMIPWASPDRVIMAAVNCAKVSLIEFRGTLEERVEKLTEAQEIMEGAFMTHKDKICLRSRLFAFRALSQIRVRHLEVISTAPRSMFDQEPLQDDLEKAKDSLRVVEDCIRSIQNLHDCDIWYWKEGLDMALERLSAYRIPTSSDEDDTDSDLEKAHKNSSISEETFSALRHGDLTELFQAFSHAEKRCHESEFVMEQALGNIQCGVTLLSSFIMGSEEERRGFWRDLGIDEGDHDPSSRVIRVCLSYWDQAFQHWALLRRQNFSNTSGDSSRSLESINNEQVFSAQNLKFSRWAFETSLHLNLHDLCWEWHQRTKTQVIAGWIGSQIQSKGTTPERIRLPDVPPNLQQLSLIQSFFTEKIRFVDWAFKDDHFVILVSHFDKVTNTPTVDVEEIESPKIAQIQLWKQNYLRPDTLCRTGYADRRLRQLCPLVAPLTRLSNNKEILILCPSSPLQHIPLHALHIRDPSSGKEVLLVERNLITYCSGFALFHECLKRAFSRSCRLSTSLNYSICGAYDDDDDESRQVKESLQSLAVKLGLEKDDIHWSSDLTRSTFLTWMEKADVIHFHGHVDTVSPSSLDHSLLLGRSPSGGALNLSAREIVGKAMITPSPHCTIIGCGGAVQDFNITGDEPMGLVPSFLLAGANSVVSTLWDIDSEDGREFTRAFYENFKAENVISSQGFPLAEAVRRASLSIRRRHPEPYHWASFVSIGLPVLKRSWHANNDKLRNLHVDLISSPAPPLSN
ncbi:CHAT domain-containing protein [Aspergillus transmontanensis]|uniref:CHAT domain-containing protein n=1 Tax=Aspergillus transmontanensis TaxID=1034304 RepID=A0A5N6W2C4_9EURO|nr:CHAT domain-containing protein [Aspergillus transmontanensis]